MRQIRVRAWDGKKMVYPHSDNGGFKGLTSGDILNRFETVMESTGLTDKNGKEIWEGDIVERRFEKAIPFGQKFIGVVTFNNIKAKFPILII